MAKISPLAGIAVGYMLGARAGRERYQQIAQKAKAVADDPRVQRITRRASEAARGAADEATAKASSALRDARPGDSTVTEPTEDPTRPQATGEGISTGATTGGPHG